MKRIALVDTAAEEWQLLPSVSIRLHHCEDEQCQAIHAWSLVIGWLNFSLWFTFEA
jgi:hypothetical protein